MKKALVALTLAYIFVFSLAAYAVPVKWTLVNVSLGGDDFASGSFVYDADSDIYSEINIITTGSVGNTPIATPRYAEAGTGAFPPKANIIVVQPDGLIDLTGSPHLLITLEVPMTNAGGTINVGSDPLRAEVICSEPTCDPFQHNGFRIVQSGAIVSGTKWTFLDVPVGGGEVTGSFIYDPVNNLYDSINIQTSAGSNPDFDDTPDYLVPGTGVLVPVADYISVQPADLPDLTGTFGLALSLLAPLTNSAQTTGVSPSGSGEVICPNSDCNGFSGTPWTAFRLGGGGSVLSLEPSELVASFNLDGSYADALGGEALSPVGAAALDGSGHSVAGHDSGLSLSGTIDPSSYSVVMTFTLDGVSDQQDCISTPEIVCSHKILDFKNRSLDEGLYVISFNGDQSSGALQLFPLADEDGVESLPFGTPHQLVLTRSALTTETAVYLDGAPILRTPDPTGYYVFSSGIVHFLTDDTQIEDDAPVGFIDSIEIYDGPLSPDQVAAMVPDAEADGDGDGVPASEDNCLTVVNPGQVDSNGDGWGDDCVDPEALAMLFNYQFIDMGTNVETVTLSGTLYGTLQGDADTVLISGYNNVMLRDVAYPGIDINKIRATVFGDRPSTSLSGLNQDSWVCPSGFTAEFLGGGDCAFGDEGGFLLSHVIDLGGNTGFAIAGDGTGDASRVLDQPLLGIWSLALDEDDDGVPTSDDNCPTVFNADQADLNGDGWGDVCVDPAAVPYAFSYEFAGNVQGEAGALLSGVIDGVLQADSNTVVISGLRDVSLRGVPYPDIDISEIRAVDMGVNPRASLDGTDLDFWACPNGFTAYFLGGGDCAFGTEGGILASTALALGGGPVGTVRVGDGSGDASRATDQPIAGIWYMEPDIDDDGWGHSLDNCPSEYNPLQTDVNGDGYGDACVDPTVTIPDNADVDPTSTIGEGSEINDGVVIEGDVDVGDDVSLNKGTTLEQGSTIGSGTTTNKNVAVGMMTSVGINVSIGQGVQIGPYVTIGDNVVLGRDVVLGGCATIHDNATLNRDVEVERWGSVAAGDTIARGEIVPGDPVSVCPSE